LACEQANGTGKSGLGPRGEALMTDLLLQA